MDPLAGVRSVGGPGRHLDGGFVHSLWSVSLGLCWPVHLHLSGLPGRLNDQLPRPPGWAPGRVGFLGSGWSPVPESCVSACVGSLTQPLMGQEGEYLGWFVMGAVAPV